MAASTVRALPIPTNDRASLLNWQTALGFATYAGLPLGLFGLANLAAQTFGQVPLFFSPFGLPGWLGAVFHLAMLPLLGAAAWIVSDRDENGSAQKWIAILIAGLIVLPFVVAPLSSTQLAFAALALVFLTIATAQRVAIHSHAAAWLLAPLLAWLGVSAVLGLALAAAWAPPFGLVQSHQPAPPAL